MRRRAPMLRARCRQGFACSCPLSVGDKRGIGATVGRARARILVVDDDADNRLALSLVLENVGYEVIEAADAYGIVGTVRNRDPDLILLDLIMPKVSGFDALAMLKRSRHTRDVPVVIVTAFGRKADGDEARARGASAHIMKPWENGEVERCIDRILASSADAGHRIIPLRIPG